MRPEMSDAEIDKTFDKMTVELVISKDRKVVRVKARDLKPQ